MRGVARLAGCGTPDGEPPALWPTWIRRVADPMLGKDHPHNADERMSVPWHRRGAAVVAVGYLDRRREVKERS
jgi:hypothetical protein